MNCLIIENGTVINKIVATKAEAEQAFPGKTVVMSNDGDIGDTYDGSTFTKPPKPPKTPKLDIFVCLGDLTETEIEGFISLLETSGVIDKTKADKLKVKS